MTAARTIQCPNCPKLFADNNAVYQHIRMKHGRKGIAPFRPRCEQSLAQELVDAHIDHLAGEPVPEHLRSMFPEEFSNDQQE
jgi:hypothetical protein